MINTNDEILEEFENLVPEDLDVDYEEPYKEILKPTLYFEELWPESMLEIDRDKLKDYIRTLLTLKDTQHATEKADWLRSEIEKLEEIKRNLQKDGCYDIFTSIITRYKEELLELEKGV